MSTRHRRSRAQAAKQVFLLIDKDNSGTLDKGEIIKAVKEDEKVKSFLATCGEPNLEFLTHPARLHKALEVLDTSKDGEVDMEEWEEAINRGLAKRLAQLAAERERRERAAEKADAEFSVEFLNAARKCFEMIDVDESGTLEKAEIVEAVTSNKKVISFLVNCGNKNLQFLLVPVRLEAALTAMDTDRDGHIDIDEWETCIEDALKNKLAARAAKRELDAKNAAKEIEEFTNEFLSAARRCFELIDKDGGGTLSTAEIVEAVKSDAEVIDFLKNCGEENLQFLLHPPRLKKALAVLDEDKSGEIDVEEWETAIQKGLAHRLEQLSIERQRRDRANARADEEFSAEFLSAARAVFLMIDKDESGFLDKEEMSARCVRPSTCARRGDGARSAAAYTPSTRLVAHRPIPAQRHRRQSRQRSDRLPHELRQQEPPVPAGPVAPRGGPRAAGLGPRRRDRLQRVVRFGVRSLGVPSIDATMACGVDGVLRCWCAGGVDVRRRCGCESVDAAHRSTFRAGRRRSRRRCGTSSRSAPRRARPRPRPPRRRSPSSRASS